MDKMNFKTLKLKDLQISGILIKNVPMKESLSAPGITYGTRDKIESLIQRARTKKIKEINFSEKL